MTLFDFLLAVAPVLGLALYCIVHFLMCRTVRGRSKYFPLFIGFGAGLVATVAASAASLAILRTGIVDFASLLGMNIVCYLALAFGYFNFINMNIASVRIRMLQELMEAGGSLPVAEFSARYNTEEVIALRIDRLLRGGHLVDVKGRYFVGRKRFLIVGRIFDFLRWMIFMNNLPPAAAMVVPSNEPGAAAPGKP